MGRYSPNLTQHQRDAITQAMIAGKTAAEVVKAAAAGKLDDLPAFKVSETACRDLRADAERNLATGDHELTDWEKHAAQARAIIVQQLEQLAAKQKKGPLSVHDIRDGIELSRWAQDLDRHEKRERRRKRPPESNGQASEDEQRSALAERLLADDQQ
jgi:hypothetical protein